MEKYIKILQQVTLFDGIGQTELLEILPNFMTEIKKYRKNEIIFLAGSTTNVMGVILFGSVQILKEDFLGNRMILAKLGEADLFGEAFCASRIKNIPVTVEAAEETEIFFINYEKMISEDSFHLKNQRKIIENMLFILALKNVFLNNRIEILSKRTIREKLIAYLQNEIRANNKLEFTIPFNRQQLADYLCIDRSAMSSELSKMKEEGIIEYERSHFVITKHFNREM